MKQFDITGMSCAACSARVEKAVSAVSGVENCSVSLLTNSMTVFGTASDADIIKAVSKAGYGVSLKPDSSEKEEDILPKENNTRYLKLRLIYSLVFLIPLMYLSMGYTMLDFPIPLYFEKNPITIGLLQMLLAICVMVINQKFFIGGFKGLVKSAPNMDTLVAIGSGASFVYSVYELFVMTGSQNPEKYIHRFYFEAAAMILTLITVGKMLEARSKGKTTNAIRALINLSPKTANVIKDGREITIPAKELNAGDIFLLRPGESIPADGTVISGISAVDESALTGESIPVDKAPGSKVSAATINLSGVLKCHADKVGEDTALSHIIKMVRDASATKAPIAKIADKVSGFFVPVVMIIAFITVIVWLIAGRDTGFALARGISVLVISCPCALGLATPVAIMVGNGVGAKHGILFKTAISLEKMGKIDIAVLDKTGTITEGHPVVTDVFPAPEISQDELLSFACSLEQNSQHPLSTAVMEYCRGKGISPFEVADFLNLPGSGLTANTGDTLMFGGNMNYISEKVSLTSEVKEKVYELSDEGKTPLLFCSEKRFLGIIAVSDTIKPDSPKAVSELQAMGIHVIMLTGDNERTAKAMGKIAGVDGIFADVFPDGKENVIRSLKEKGNVAMVGDGINDAPALTCSDVGVAIGAGSDVAIDAAEVVLVNSRLSDVTAAIRLSRNVIRNIRQNLFWAFFYNMIGIPLAAGVFIPYLGWELNPMFGAAAMSLSSFCVVTNALRLNFCNIRSSKYDHKRKNKIKEKKIMTKTMKIEGMMCGHCEARVKKILEALDEVQSADVSHEKGTALVNLNCDIENAKLKDAVEAQDYKVLDIQ